MVKGLDVFIKYFKDFSQNYVIIGGTACDLIIDEAGFYPRATKDIDLILVVEALSSDFVKQFWKFVKDGRYERNESSDTDRKYYRFIKPDQEELPGKELFRNMGIGRISPERVLSQIIKAFNFEN